MCADLTVCVCVSLQSTCWPHMHVPASLPPTLPPNSQSRLSAAAIRASHWPAHWSRHEERRGRPIAWRSGSNSKHSRSVTAGLFPLSCCLTGAELQHNLVWKVWIKCFIFSSSVMCSLTCSVSLSHPHRSDLCSGRFQLFRYLFCCWSECRPTVCSFKMFYRWC